MIKTRKLRQAIKTGDIKQVAEILREDPKGKLRLYGGFTPLHVAVKGGNKAVVEATPLHNAVYKGSAKMVKLLLAHGADPDITNASGVNAIDAAERKNHTHLARLMEAHIDKKLSLEATKSEIEPLYTVQKVAALLSVDDTFVLDLIKTRKITGLQLDEKTLRITAGSIQRYLAKLAK